MKAADIRAGLFSLRALNSCAARTTDPSAVSARQRANRQRQHVPKMSVGTPLALTLAVTLFLGAPLSAYAEQPSRQFSIWPLATKMASSPNIASVKPPCRCVFKGRRYEQGDMVCIKLPGSVERSVRCGLMLNNTSWITAPGACTPIS